MPARSSPQISLDTLAIDIGGTGLKASVLDGRGQMEHARVRTDTPYPLSPERLVLELQNLIAPLPRFERISVGFPGMVRGGRILSAPHFVSPDGPGGVPAPKLVRAWQDFDLAAALERVTGKPVKVANDADVQGAAVVTGRDFEAVVTLGTGFGSAFFDEGRLLPHFELAHHPLRKAKSYNEVLGEAARRKAGTKKWRSRVFDAIETLRALTFFDHCFIGGGNSARLGDDLPRGVSVVDNSAGILGGIKLWEVTAAPAGTLRRSPRSASAPATNAGSAAPGSAPGDGRRPPARRSRSANPPPAPTD
jgi:polyphosphate glucokinase